MSYRPIRRPNTFIRFDLKQEKFLFSKLESVQCNLTESKEHFKEFVSVRRSIRKLIRGNESQVLTKMEVNKIVEFLIFFIEKSGSGVTLSPILDILRVLVVSKEFQQFITRKDLSRILLKVITEKVYQSSNHRMNVFFMRMLANLLSVKSFSEFILRHRTLRSELNQLVVAVLKKRLTIENTTMFHSTAIVLEWISFLEYQRFHRDLRLEGIVTALFKPVFRSSLSLLFECNLKEWKKRIKKRNELLGFVSGMENLGTSICNFIESCEEYDVLGRDFAMKILERKSKEEEEEEEEEEDEGEESVEDDVSGSSIIHPKKIWQERVRFFRRLLLPSEMTEFKRMTEHCVKIVSSKDVTGRVGNLLSTSGWILQEFENSHGLYLDEDRISLDVGSVIYPDNYGERNKTSKQLLQKDWECCLNLASQVRMKIENNFYFSVEEKNDYGRMVNFLISLESKTKVMLQLPSNKYTYFKVLTTRAYTNYEVGNYESAIPDFIEALKKDPNRMERFQVNKRIANCFYFLKKYKLAIKHYEEAIKNNETYICVVRKAICNYNLRNFRIAKKDFEIALRVGKKDMQTETESADKMLLPLLNKAVCHMELGELETAEKLFSKSITIISKLRKLPTNIENMDTLEYVSRINLAKIIPSLKLGSVNRKHIDSGNIRCAIEEYGRAISILEEENNLEKSDVACYCRGLLFLHLGFYAMALKDFEEAVKQNPNESSYYAAKGYCNFEFGMYQDARKDFISGLKVKPGCRFNGMNLGIVEAKLGGIFRSDNIFRDLRLSHPDDTLINEGRFTASLGHDSHRSLEDLSTVILRRVEGELLQLGVLNDRTRCRISNSDHFEGVFLNSMTRKSKARIIIVDDYADLLQKVTKCWKKKTEWRHFRNTGEILKKMIELEDDLMRKSRFHLEEFSYSDVQVLENIGSGAFGVAYLCRIIEFEYGLMKNYGGGGSFVLKIISKPSNLGILSEKEEKDRFENEFLVLPYHPNVVPILGRTDISEKNLKNLPDYDSGWREALEYVEDQVSLGAILMKYHRKDLQAYVIQRVKDGKKKFHSCELRVMMVGILKGLWHLHENKVVHRDLNLGNIFVDETYGRVWVGDFSCALDLRNVRISHGSPFKIPKNSPLLQNYTSSYSNSIGYASFRAPEIVNPNDSKSYLDYAKVDLFAAGMIGYYLVSSFVGDGICAPFGHTLEKASGSVRENPIRVNRKQERYIQLQNLEEDVSRERYDVAVGLLLQIDPKNRIGYSDAIELLEENE